MSIFDRFVERFATKRPVRVTFHMDSGRNISFKCTSFKAKHDHEGALVEYNAEGVDPTGLSQLFWVSLRRVESVTVVKKD